MHTQCTRMHTLNASRCLSQPSSVLEAEDWLVEDSLSKQGLVLGAFLLPGLVPEEMVSFYIPFP